MGKASTPLALFQDTLGCDPCTSVSRRWAGHLRSRASQDKERASVFACQLKRGARAAHVLGGLRIQPAIPVRRLGNMTNVITGIMAG